MRTRRTPEQVAGMKADWAAGGMSYAELAQKWGVPRGSVGAVLENTKRRDPLAAELRAAELLTQALEMVDETRRIDDEALRQERWRDTEPVVLAAAYACRRAAK